MKGVYTTSLVLKNVIYKANLGECNLRPNFYREWDIWSKCFGKVLVINGTSSSGKTTFCQYLFKYGFNLISSDETLDEVFFDFIDRFTKNISLVKSFLKSSDMTRVLQGYKIKVADYVESQLIIVETLQDEINHILKHSFPSKMEIYDKIYDKSKKYIFSGQNVVVDIVAKGESVDMLSYCFGHYPIQTVLLYSSLEENLKKCFKRNYISSKTDAVDYRYPAIIVDQYNSFYTFAIKSNLSKKDKVIEIIDKGKTHAILEVAKCFDYNLFLYLKDKLYSEEDYYPNKMSHSEVMQWMDTKVKKLESDMMLDTSNEVCVLPKVKCDFIFKSPFFTLFGDLISNNSHYQDTADPAIIGDMGLIVESEYGSY